jgi:hypothetical protein
VKLLCHSYRQAYILKEDNSCVFIIAERCLKAQGNYLKSMVESVETERIGAEGASPYEAKANYLFSSLVTGQQETSNAIWAKIYLYVTHML